MNLNPAITFENIEGITDTQLDEVENLYGKKLPAFLIEYLTKYAGAKPAIDGENCLVTREENGEVYDVTYIQRIPGNEGLLYAISMFDNLPGLAEHFETPDSYVEPQYLFPIAKFPNGTGYVATEGIHIGKVYTADNGDFGIIYQSPSIEAFFSALRKDDIVV